MYIAEGGLDDPRVVALLEIHVTRALAETGRGSGHALDLPALIRTPGLTSGPRGKTIRERRSWVSSPSTRCRASTAS